MFKKILLSSLVLVSASSLASEQEAAFFVLSNDSGSSSYNNKTIEFSVYDSAAQESKSIEQFQKNQRQGTYAKDLHDFSSGPALIEVAVEPVDPDSGYRYFCKEMTLNMENNAINTISFKLKANEEDDGFIQGQCSTMQEPGQPPYNPGP